MSLRLSAFSLAVSFAVVAGCGGRTMDDTGSTGPGSAGAGAGGGSGAGGGAAGTGTAGTAGTGTAGTGTAGTGTAGTGTAGTGTAGAGGAGAAGKGGAGTAGTGAGGCPDTPPVCAGCAGSTVSPVCTPSGWSCPPVPSCPAFCTGPGQCGGASFCASDPFTCPSPQQPGLCEPIPQGCPKNIDPHCGCFTGKQYTNECFAQASGEPALPCNGAGGTGGAGGAGGGGPGATCSSDLGLGCAPGLYCDYPDKQCGENDGPGVCTPGPIDKCGGDGLTCGCDHKVYPVGCAAQAAGVDASIIPGWCAQPPGTFVCGYHFCNAATEYCQRDGSDIGGFADGYACHSLPKSCFSSGGPSCACLGGVTCGTACQAGPDGSLMVTCFGG